MKSISKVVLVFVQCLLCASVALGMCATQCNGVPDGTYPDCKSCEKYVRCFNNRTTTVFCMEGTVFDVKISECNYPEQSTCGNERLTSPTTSPSTTTSVPISVQKRLTSPTTSPTTITSVPISVQKRLTSPTTSQTTTTSVSIIIQPGQCVSDCKAIPDGDYQSCQSCLMYVSCSNEEINDKRPCAATLMWDDVAKMCLWSSTTCN